MNPVIFVGHTVPDKRLIKTYNFKKYLSSEQQAEILEEIKKSGMEIEEKDGVVINMQIDIEVKYYDTRPVEKQWWYEADAPKNT